MATFNLPLLTSPEGEERAGRILTFSFFIVHFLFPPVSCISSPHLGRPSHPQDVTEGWVKKKVPVNRDLSEFYLLCFFNNTPLLKSRLGLKKVVKIKECVAELHFCSFLLR